MKKEPEIKYCVGCHSVLHRVYFYSSHLAQLICPNDTCSRYGLFTFIRMDTVIEEEK